MKKIYLIGKPLSHSKSPIIHNYWLKKYKIDAKYETKEIEEENIEEIIRSIYEDKIIGINITLPYKEKISKYLDNKSEELNKIKACNLIYKQNNTLFGDNTDCIGFIKNLNYHVPDWQETTHNIIILGSGGSARAVLYGLLSKGLNNITLFNRTYEKAAQLAQEFKVSAKPLIELNDNIHKADLLINTTSAGILGNDDILIDWKKLKKQCLITDISYAPIQTPFLVQARMHGLKTISGIGMLLFQAEPCFEKWFHIKPEIDEQLLNLVGYEP